MADGDCRKSVCIIL